MIRFLTSCKSKTGALTAPVFNVCLQSENIFLSKQIGSRIGFLFFLK